MSASEKTYHAVVAYNIAVLIRQSQQFHLTISKTEALWKQSLDCHTTAIKHASIFTHSNSTTSNSN